MSDEQRKKNRFLSLLSIPIPGIRVRRPAPIDVVHATTTSGGPTSPESVVGSSRTNDLQTVHARRPDQNTESLFSNIEQLNIRGGNFNQNIYNINNRDDENPKHVALHLPLSRDAAFSAAINDNLARRPCTNGTRVGIIKEIMAWVNEKDPAKAPPVYWLNGLAGVGKTTIAYTICEMLNKAHLPFASFFCSLQLDSRNSRLLVPTLCRDLSEFCDSYEANVLSVLATNSKAVHAGLRIQIDALLAKPWQASNTQRKDRDLPTPIVVVDALDESDHGTEFLKELLHVIHAGQLTGIKFLVTSRLDPQIVDICDSFPPNAVCKLHEVDIADVQNDIAKYLQETLPKLKGEPELAMLSERAGGLFIYATTAVKFISSPSKNPPSVAEMRFLLRTMLDAESLSSDGDTGERLLVDGLYEQILGGAFWNPRLRAARLQILHTIVCAESGIDISVLANLTKSDQDTVKAVVDSLHAVLFVSPKDGCVYWYHASFPDFVLSRARSRISLSLHERHQIIDVFCNARDHHAVLARQCFCVMQESLHFNMCSLPSSHILDSEVPGLEDSIDMTFTPTLRYVSRHWATHLVQAEHAKNDDDDLLCSLKKFLFDKLLFWMEAMNLIGAKFECASSLKDAESWIERGKQWPDLLDQLAGGTSFSVFFAGSPASKSTPHLYISALPIWNQNSAIWEHWKDRFKFIRSIVRTRGAITIPLLTISTPRHVNSIAISPDGNQIISGGGDESVWVWDAKTGEQLRELQGHTNYVLSVSFSLDGKRIVSGSADKSVRMWDAKTGEQLKELRGHTGYVASVTFSPDGTRIVSGSEDKSVRVWDAKTGEQLRELGGHTDGVCSVSFSPDGNRIVSGSRDESARVWDAKTGEHLRRLQGHIYAVESVTFSPGGDRIASGSYDNSVRVWDAKTGEQLMELQGHNDDVNSVTFSPDGNRIASGSDDRSVLVWDVKTGEQLGELQGHTDRVRSVSFSPDGNRIISASDDASVRVWDTKTSEQWKGLQGHTDCVRSVSFSPDGNRIVSGSQDTSVRVWDAKKGGQLMELRGHISLVGSVSFSPDGNRIVSGSWDQSSRVWDAKTGEQLVELQGHTDFVTSVSFSPDGDQIVSGSRDTSVRVWNSKTGEQLRELQGHPHWVTSVSFSPDGNQIVSGSQDGSVRVWDAKTGEQLRELQGHTHVVTSVSFSPDGNRITSASWVSVQVWNAKTGEQLRGLQGHTGLVNTVSFSADGNRIAFGSHDKSVSMWDAKTGRHLRELRGHSENVFSVSFSPDGNRIVSGCSDNSVRVWSNLKVDALWVVDRDGWIVSGSERLVWVPSTFRNVLLRPHNTLIISRNGSATISLTQCKLGSLWHECYIR